MKNASVAEDPGKAGRDRPNGRPTWDVALLFPEQGNWSVEEYLALPGNRLVEYADGRLEVLPMPTTLHQWIVFHLCQLLDAFVSSRQLGLALLAPLRVQLWPDKFREPDVVFLRTEHRDRAGEEFWDGADLVMEVVSDGREDRRRDLVTKRREYARAGIPEYWIVDPRRKQIAVLRLKGEKYVVHGTFKPGRTARSHLLPGFTVDVAAALAGPR
jgi:Uma2 family endonuclease